MTDGKLFDGDVVVCHNRPFATESFIGLAGPSQGNTVVKAAGETAVEAIFGYGPPGAYGPHGAQGYAPNTNTILLRWPSSMPDPDLRVGGWIADVTYEQSASSFGTKITAGPGMSAQLSPYPYNRCHWYRIAKKSEVGLDPGFSDDPGGVTFRRIVLTTAQPVQARTLLNSNGQPTFVNTALVMPSVVNVYSRVFMVRNSGETNDL